MEIRFEHPKFSFNFIKTDVPLVSKKYKKEIALWFLASLGFTEEILRKENISTGLVKGRVNTSKVTKRRQPK